MDSQAHVDTIIRVGQKQLRKMANRYVLASVVLFSMWLAYCVLTVARATTLSLIFPLVMSIPVALLLGQAHKNRRRLLLAIRALDFYAASLQNKDCNAATDAVECMPQEKDGSPN